jgi:hypothetical protein
MPRIQGIIPSQAFEIIRNRIADIIIDELQNQKDYTGDDELNCNIVLEQRIAFDKSELTIINIAMTDADFSNQHQGQSDGDYKYNVDVIAGSPSDDVDQGDTLASKLVQKIIGKLYAIMTNAQYRTLGFNPGSGGIQRVSVTPITIGNLTQGDTRSTTIARMVVTVRASQTTELLGGILAAGYDTQIKIAESNSGFKYTVE